MRRQGRGQFMSKKVVSIVLAVVLALFALPALAAAGSPAGVSGAALATPTVTLAAGDSLQAAVSAASSQAVIDLGGNSFDVAGSLLISQPGITIQNGTINLIPVGANSSSSMSAIIIKASNVTLQGLTINGCDAGADSRGSVGVMISSSAANPLSDINILNNAFTIGTQAAPGGAGDPGTGVETSSGNVTGLTIDSNTFTTTSKGTFAIYLNPKATAKISNNVISGTYLEPVSMDSGTVTVKGNTFEECQALNATQALIHGYNSSALTVTDNTFNGDGSATYAVWVQQASALTAFDNNTINNFPINDGKIAVVAVGAGDGFVNTDSNNSVPFDSAEGLVTYYSATYNVTVVGGTGAGMYTVGDTVEISAGEAPAGQVFAGWSSEDGISFEDTSAASTSFVMPAGPVIVTATWTAESAPKGEETDKDATATGGQPSDETAPKPLPPAATQKGSGNSGSSGSSLVKTGDDSSVWESVIALFVAAGCLVAFVMRKNLRSQA